MSMSCSVMSVIIAGLFLGASARAEKRIKRSELPAAVEKAVATASRGATVRGFSREEESGKTYYEVEMIVNGRSKDVLLDANGDVVEVEEDVSIDSLPAEVKEGLQAKAGKGKLQKVESLTKHGKLVAYEAQVTINGKRLEVQVGPNGTPLDHRE